MNKRDKAALKKVLIEHRKCVSKNWTDYMCLCGKVLRSNSHHALAEHQVEVIDGWIKGEVL